MSEQEGFRTASSKPDGTNHTPSINIEPTLHNKWGRFIDAITILWLGIFFANIYKPGLIPGSIELGLLGFFVADLVVKARAEPNFPTFLRKRWTDILMVIPYFRVFRILRFTRLLRFLRMARVARVGRFPGLKSLEALRRKASRAIKRLKGYGQEG